LVELQLCGLPKQASTLPVSWKIVCDAVNISKSFADNFNLEQSCWGWGNGLLSFETFRKCDEFEIMIVIELDDDENVRAMVKWNEFVHKTNAGKRRSNAPPPPLDDQKQDHLPSTKQDDDESIHWVQQRLKGQAEELKALRLEMEKMKEGHSVSVDEHDGPENAQSDDLRKRVFKVENQMASLMQRVSGTVDVDGDDDEHGVHRWFRERVKLPQYAQLFEDEGFDDLESIRDATESDLVAMGIDKVGHRKRILKQSALIR